MENRAYENFTRRVVKKENPKTGVQIRGSRRPYVILYRTFSQIFPYFNKY